MQLMSTHLSAVHLKCTDLLSLNSILKQSHVMQYLYYNNIPEPQTSSPQSVLARQIKLKKVLKCNITNSKIKCKCIIMIYPIVFMQII